ncbi:MAG: hypothetical protein PHG18_02360 [Bacilli bacterium]|nr:hypothetical protein [Bacilli bacterium]
MEDNNANLSNVQIAGRDSIQVNGNNIDVNIYKGVGKKYNYKILSKVSEQLIVTLNSNKEMSIACIPAEIIEKIEYNGLLPHRKIFLNHSIYLDQIEYVMEQILGDTSEKIVSRIITKWDEIAFRHSELSNDELLYRLEGELLNKIDPNVVDEFCLEDVQTSIEQIIFYVFSKCQILNNPNNSGDKL